MSYAAAAERFARVGKQMATTTAHLPALAAARKTFQLTEEEKKRAWVRKEDGKLRLKRSASFSKFEEHSWTMPTLRALSTIRLFSDGPPPRFRVCVRVVRVGRFFPITSVWHFCERARVCGGGHEIDSAL